MTCFLKLFASRLITLLLLSFVLTGYPSVSSAEDELTSVNAVLTLEEAANYLRVTQDEVVRLIKEDCLPGRSIGEQWRFSRTALMDWLAQKEPYTNCGHMTPVHEMSSVTGRGTNSADTEAAAAKPETVGEKPEFQTAEDASLRGEQYLLKANQLTIEPGLFYSKSEQQGLTVTQVGDTALLAFAEGEQDRFLSNITLRYGMKHDLQLSVSVPYIYQKDTTTATIAGTTQTETISDRRDEFVVYGNRLGRRSSQTIVVRYRQGDGVRSIGSV